MRERGAEVEHLMSLDGTPLLVDMSANSDSACGGPKTNQAGKASSNDDVPTEDGGDRETPLPQAEASENRRRRGDTNAAAGGPTVEKTAPPYGSGGRKNSKALLSRSTSTPSGVPREDLPGKGGTTAAVNPSKTRLSAAPSPPRGLDASRVLATASTPQLPSFSLGSSPQPAFRGGKPNQQGGQSDRNGDRALSNTCNATSPVTEFANALSAPVYCHHGRAARWAGVNVSDRAQQSRNSGPSHRPATLGMEEGRAALAAARDRASTLLASHLTPFPTITKNRSLHAVSQPIVRHSEGFADACRGEMSRSGTSAWRVTRDARYDGLVAPADRLSIVRQIEAGFDTLQGRSDRVSPVA